MTVPKTRNLIAIGTALTLGASIAAATPALAQSGWFTGDRDQITRQMNEAAARYDLQPVAYIEADDDEFEAYTLDAQGNRAKIELDRYGNVDEVEIKFERRANFVGNYASESEVRQSIEDAGYEFVALVDRKKRHYEIMARGANDEMAGLHVDFGGAISKVKYEPAKFGSERGWAPEGPGARERAERQGGPAAGFARGN